MLARLPGSARRVKSLRGLAAGDGGLCPAGGGAAVAATGVCSGPVLAWRGLAPVGLGVAVAMPDAALARRLRGVLAGVSAQLLVEAGLNAERLAWLEPLNLVDDVAELLIWALAEPVLTRTRGGDAPGAAWSDDQDLAALVEARRDEVFGFGRSLLVRLRLWLEG